VRQFTCPICSANAEYLDVVDFNKTCEENKGVFLPKSGTPIYYALCNQCQFCFSPEMMLWDSGQFKSHVYNDDYLLIDSEYEDIRPQRNFSLLNTKFGQFKKDFSHLDYGGGNGRLSSLLTAEGFNSLSYDVFVDDFDAEELDQKFDLITSFEVFEHHPDPVALIKKLCALLTPNGIILFSTILSDNNIKKNQRLDWFYASPRNGHISLFSTLSLGFLAGKFGFNLASDWFEYHIFYKEKPEWAVHFLGS
jgi:SAM-dependent methyltransferase